ncbi:inositol monophosphatase family protein [Azospirillum halopraeferens]|uniref:inositol monophosphatase family protein n=1 Tax=Azospirillum halopraeferens TaxID=34010 RepID=UPI0004002935|nr:inositol monophosphatase [Azospirillum halopraeferens]
MPVDDRTDDLTCRLAAGAAVAREAGRLARRYFDRRGDLRVETKGPQDLVSLADRAVEDLIRTRLAALFPGDAMVGEEGGGTAGRRVWVVDPIDGTQNFLRGMPWYCVVLALVEDGRTDLGIIYDPNTDELFTARRGGGAFLNGEPIRVSGCSDPAAAVVGVGHSPRHPPDRFLIPFTHLLEAGAQTRNLLCGALQLAHVACGRLDATWDPHLLPWDVLAGILLVEEAGGAAAPYPLRPDWSGGAPLLAGTPALVETIGRAMGMTAAG